MSWRKAALMATLQNAIGVTEAAAGARAQQAR